MLIKRTTLDELLSYEGEQFVQCAYYILFARKADPDGLESYAARLGSGVSRLRIITELVRSGEGRALSLEVEGLSELLAEERRRHGWRRLFQGSRQAIVAPVSVPPWFDPVWYLDQYPDVAHAHEAPYDHYRRYGQAEGRCPMFDPSWYALEYPDVAASGLSPREHYDNKGRRLGRAPWFDAQFYLQNNPDVAMNGLAPREHYERFGRSEGRPVVRSGTDGRNDYTHWLARFGTHSEADLRSFRERCATFARKPVISVVVPVYNPEPRWLVEALDSVCNQIYPGWELCIADDASTRPEIRAILQGYADRDPRVRVTFRERNGHICAASNSAIALASGEWIALLDQDDLLPPDALYRVVEMINADPDARLIYSDEDKIDEDGVRFYPYFKCDWNEDLFHFHNMISHLGVYYRALVSEIGGFRPGYEGSQDYDLALRCIERIRRDQIKHIPRVLYHWRSHEHSTASSLDSKPYAVSASLRALQEHLDRRGIAARVEMGKTGQRVVYALPAHPPLVSLIIPTRNGLRLLRQCVESIFARTSYSPFELIIVDNGSDDPEALAYLDHLALKASVRVIRDPGPFNFSALNNGAVRVARGEILGLINNDIEVIGPDWLTEMVRQVLRPDVGAVGACLWYPDDTLQHGGVVLGLGGVASHAHKGLRRGESGYMARATAVQEFSAVTGACLVVRRAVYEEVGGLNETDLKVAFNDVDFCIRVAAAGYRNIWTPYAELYHHESATRGTDVKPEQKARFEGEIAYMMRRWPAQLAYDPAYSPNLTVHAEDFSFAWPPRPDWPGRRQ